MNTAEARAAGMPVRVGAAIGIGIGVLALSSAALGGALPSEIVACGQTITTSLRVANNLVDCPANGLVVGASGITIDLGGHRIDGVDAGVSAGIDVDDLERVVVRNGVLSDFAFGVSLSGSSNSTLSGLRAFSNDSGINLSNNFDNNTVKGNTLSGNSVGIRLFGSSGVVIQANTASDNEFEGILLSNGSNDNVLQGNLVSGNVIGISVTDSSGSTLKDNRLFANVQSGIVLQGSSSNNSLTANQIVGTGLYGILVFGASTNLLKGNLISGGGFDGIHLDPSSSNNTLLRNRISACDAFGIEIDASTGNVLTANAVHENGIHGIFSNTAALTLTGNRADRNGFLGGGPGDDDGLGILVPEGTVNSKNKAAGNDDPNECELSDLNCYVP